MDIDEIIEFEGEHTGLDFKATQYRKETFHELLKDVISMANAYVEGNRLIITGVKKHPDGTLTINPIPRSEFQDSAIYQQLILDNIEPDLHIDYQPHLYKGSDLVGVITIPAGTDKPYMMKKLYNSEKGVRKPGESFIRKGTTTAPIMRKDIDRITGERIKADAFSHAVTCYFSGTDKAKVLHLSPNSPRKICSQRKADEIRAILSKRDKEEKERAEKMKQGKLLSDAFPFPRLYNNVPVPFFQPTTYEQRSTQTLLKNLENIGETYSEEDHYEVFEKYSHKINLSILNEGTKYLEDATIQVRIAEVEGLIIADKIYRKPVYRSPLENLNPPPINIDYEAVRYSRYLKENGEYVFTQHVDDLRHLQPKDMFDVPMRVVVGNALIGKEIELKLTIHGKNLPVPITDTLHIKVEKKE